MHWKCSSRHHFITLLQEKITSKVCSVHLLQISASSPLCMRTFLFSAATHPVPHSLNPANAPMWRHTCALPIESKQATHRHSQFLQKKSIQPTIILNFDFWVKELKELSSLLQFACSTTRRKPLHTTHTKHKNQKKLWHKFCCNPSAPSKNEILRVPRKTYRFLQLTDFRVDVSRYLQNGLDVRPVWKELWYRVQWASVVASSTTTYLQALSCLPRSQRFSNQLLP
jgi:hypothetical protein